MHTCPDMCASLLWTSLFATMTPAGSPAACQQGLVNGIPPPNALQRAHGRSEIHMWGAAAQSRPVTKSLGSGAATFCGSWLRPFPAVGP